MQVENHQLLDKFELSSNEIVLVRNEVLSVLT